MVSGSQAGVTATLGIDLASQPKNTAVCCVAWGSGHATVALLHKGVDEDGRQLDDVLLLDSMLNPQCGLPPPSKIAIDAPLGWPVDFIRGVSNLGSWPVSVGADRRRLERRATDHWIHRETGKQPLSVTTDRIAYAAMRAAGLLCEYSVRTGEHVDRTGMTGPICEAYPDPAIRRFALWPGEIGARKSYKDKARPLREQIIARLASRAPWLELCPRHQQACADADDCLDALVCALIARATERGLTEPPPDYLEVEARSEGWIQVPRREALHHLV